MAGGEGPPPERALQGLLRARAEAAAAALEENAGAAGEVRREGGLAGGAGGGVLLAPISARRPRRKAATVPKVRGGRLLRVPLSRFFRAYGAFTKPEPSRDAARSAELFRKMPLTFSFRFWRGTEVDALRQGVRQQIVRMRLREMPAPRAVAARAGGSRRGRGGAGAGAGGAGGGLGAGAERVWGVYNGLSLTDDDARRLLPRVDWAEVAEAFCQGRSAQECERKWRTDLDPAVNRGPWTPEEDARLQTLAVVHHTCAWASVAAELGTRRLPHACLARYQALNAPRGGAWTPAEDARLRELVAKYPLRDWQGVASEMPGKDREACMNRWNQSLREGIKRGVPWTPEEDEALRASVREHGEDWLAAAAAVPGRTNTACRERYVRRLRPGINSRPWSPAEVEALERFASEYMAASGRVSWVKVAKALEDTLGVVKSDSQCKKRWGMRAGRRDKKKKGKTTKPGAAMQATEVPPMSQPVDAPRRGKKDQATKKKRAGGARVPAGTAAGAASTPAPAPAARGGLGLAGPLAQGVGLGQGAGAGDLGSQIELWMQGGVPGAGGGK